MATYEGNDCWNCGTPYFARLEGGAERCRQCAYLIHGTESPPKLYVLVRDDGLYGGTMWEEPDERILIGDVPCNVATTVVLKKNIERLVRTSVDDAEAWQSTLDELYELGYRTCERLGGLPRTPVVGTHGKTFDCERAGDVGYKRDILRSAFNQGVLRRDPSKTGPDERAHYASKRKEPKRRAPGEEHMLAGPVIALPEAGKQAIVTAYGISGGEGSLDNPFRMTVDGVTVRLGRSSASALDSWWLVASSDEATLKKLQRDIASSIEPSATPRPDTVALSVLDRERFDVADALAKIPDWGRKGYDVKSLAYGAALAVSATIEARRLVRTLEKQVPPSRRVDLLERTKEILAYRGLLERTA